METKFKTLINSKGEYCVIDTSLSDNVMIGTSSIPSLLGKDVKIEDLKNYFNECYNVVTNSQSFDWDKDIPKDWMLIDIEVVMKSIL